MSLDAAGRVVGHALVDARVTAHQPKDLQVVPVDELGEKIGCQKRSEKCIQNINYCYIFRNLKQHTSKVIFLKNISLQQQKYFHVPLNYIRLILQM